MTRKDFLRFIFFKGFLFLFLFGNNLVLAAVKASQKQNKQKKSNKNAKKKRTRKDRRTKVSKKKKRRFSYKRGGPDLKVLTKDSIFNEVPDNGVTPVETSEIIYLENKIIKE